MQSPSTREPLYDERFLALVERITVAGPVQHLVRDLLAAAANLLAASEVSLAPPESPHEGNSDTELRVPLVGTPHHLFVRWTTAPPQAVLDRARVLSALVALALRNAELERRVDSSTSYVTLGRAAAAVIHDLANPLSVLIGCVEALNPEATDDEVLRDARAATSLMRTVCDRFRQVIRRTEDTPRSIIVADAVAVALRIARVETAGRAEVVVRVPKGLTVRACPGDVEQVLLNLVVNAAQAVAGLGGTQHRILVTAADAGSHVDIEVHDTGPGIMPEELAKIWTAGFTTKANNRGTGLGLDICRDIVEKLGGEISILPTGIEKGTRVRTRFPRGDVQPREVRRAADDELRSQVLIVDSDPAVAVALKRAFGETARVSIASSSTEAASLFDHRPFDLVLCDERGPTIDGIALRRRYVERWPGLTQRFVLMVSGVAEQLPSRARFITKPVESATLRALLDDSGVERT